MEKYAQKLLKAIKAKRKQTWKRSVGSPLEERRGVQETDRLFTVGAVMQLLYSDIAAEVAVVTVTAVAAVDNNACDLGSVFDRWSLGPILLLDAYLTLLLLRHM